MNQQNFNQNELEQLLNSPQSKGPIIVALVVGFLGIIFMGATGFIIFKGVNSNDFQNAFQQAFQQAYQEAYQEAQQETCQPESGDQDSSNEGENLIRINSEQAKTWVETNQANLQLLVQEIKENPKLTSVWLASAQDLNDHNVYAWINDVVCTADPSAVRNTGDDSLLLFSDVLQDLGVPVTSFYSINSAMRSVEISGYELSLSSEGQVQGVDLYHAKYDGVFYFVYEGGAEPGTSGEKIKENWWYFP